MGALVLKDALADYRKYVCLMRSSLQSGVTAVKVAEADIVVVTVRPQRMSRDGALISKDGDQESTVSY